MNERSIGAEPQGRGFHELEESSDLLFGVEAFFKQCAGADAPLIWEILFLVFNIIPYFVLVIVGNKRGLQK